jgi:hypothetical protein
MKLDILKTVFLYGLLISEEFGHVKAPATLKAGFGVNFKHVGQLQPSINKRFMTLAFHLPKYGPLSNYSELITDCPNLPKTSGLYSEGCINGL